MSTRNLVRCRKCQNVIGEVIAQINLSTVLPAQFRGLAAMIPRDTNTVRVVLDVLEIECVSCRPTTTEAVNDGKQDSKESLFTQAQHAQGVRDGKDLSPIGG